ncbi:Protein CbbX [Lasiodiplodia theobromae]|uniref:Protein CbbX n=1 Tax=Lasiodiplodia theobromae TaxID=45133 RepID=A0A5N5CV25_9PEZI|nr:Protein CbbX [Lasiodiplodia theobromae]
MQSSPPQFGFGEQQSQHTTVQAPQQCLTPEWETRTGHHSTQFPQMQTTLPMGNVQTWQGDVLGSVQEGQGLISVNNNHINPTPPPSATASESTQPPSRGLEPRPFQHPASLAAEEWKRQKLEEDADNKAIDKMMELVGLEKVKEQVLVIRDKVEVYKKQRADIKKERFNAIFQGNPGSGKTTVARLYAKFLESIDVLDSDYVEETSGSKLAAAGVSGAQRILNEITEDNDGGVLFIDEAYQLVAPHVCSAGRQVLDLILTEMENNIGKLIVIFVGYAKDMEKLFEHNPGLPSRVPYTLHFEDFSDEELWRVLCDSIDKKYNGKMKVEDTVDGLYMRVAIRRLGQGRCGRGFGNARAVENLLAQMAGRQAKRLKTQERSGGNPDHFFLTKEDLLGPDPTSFQSAAWTRLQELIGLDSVKQSVRNMISMVDQNYRREMAEMKPLQVSLNQVFVGSPGTGKTTVAKLYGQILADLGLLSKGDVVLKNPSDFIGDCVGKSEANTRGILAATAGKVLIIDEAYMLDGGGGGGGGTGDGSAHHHQDSFKTGVIDTLVAEVQGTLGEDRCIILAGYEDKMQAMFRNCNPGLARRFPIESAFRFEDFNVDQLMQVLELKMREQDMRATEGGLGAARDVLGRTLMRPSFSNGGEVERCLAAAKANYQARQAKRPAAEREFDTLLEAEDFDPDHGRTAADGCCRKMLEGLVDDSVISKLDEVQQLWHAAKQRNRDPRALVSTRFVFKGGPGTGKTTAANTIGRMFHALGLLATPDVISCSPADLIGQYVGQTAPKTRAQLSKALGKVLVIDDAHNLHNNTSSTFAAEALNELVAFLANPQHADRLVVVLAGHTAGMNALMASAPALAAHFQEEVVFEDIGPRTCVELLGRELGRLGVLSGHGNDGDGSGGADGEDAALPPPFLADPHDPGYGALERVFAELSRLPSWSNARDVRALATRVARAQMVAAAAAAGRSDGEGRRLDEVVEKCAREMLGTQRERCGDDDGGRGGVVVVRRRHLRRQQQQQEEEQPLVKAEMAEAPPLPPPPPVQTAVTQAVDEGTAAEDARAGEDGEAEVDEDGDEDERSEEDTQALLRRIGRCEAGFAWRKEGSGWRCEGGSHYVSNEQLNAYTS